MAWMFDQVLGRNYLNMSLQTQCSRIQVLELGALQPDLWRLCECRLGQEEKPRRDGLNLRCTPTFIFWEESGDPRSRSPSAIAD